MYDKLKEEYEETNKQIQHLEKNRDLLNEKGVHIYYKLIEKKEILQKKMKNEYPIIAVDFDGVLNKYKGWEGENKLSVPQSGVKYFLEELNKDYSVIIFTVRDTDKVKEWLIKYELDKYVLHVTDMKPKAVAYIDDRAIKYNGNYGEVLKELEQFKTWWEK